MYNNYNQITPLIKSSITRRSESFHEGRLKSLFLLVKYLGIETKRSKYMAKISNVSAASNENSEFKKLLDEYNYKVPKVGDIIKGKVITASKSEVRLDIDGIMTGLIRGIELYSEADEYANLKPGDEVEATVVENENEFGEMELSFRHVGQEKAWESLHEAHEKKGIVKVRVANANKGGLLVNYRQIAGFLPVSQLSPENYPRVEGGDKSKILDKLRSFIGKDIEVKPITLDAKEDKIIFSEKEAWMEKRQDVISQYKVGSVVEGEVTAVTDFGVFIKFGENLEGLIHISELAWQRIDNPNSLHRVGDIVKAEIIEMDGSKVFLSAKKLIKDPWEEVEKKFKVNQTVKGKILKVNPFGLFVSLDDDIHGLAHVNSLNLAPGQKIQDIYKEGETRDMVIISIEAKEHRLGLSIKSEKEIEAEKKASKKSKEAEDKKEETEVPAEEKKEKSNEEKKAKPKKATAKKK